MNTQVVDTIIIGTGSAGQTAAYALSEKGQKVAIIDNRPFGGTCQLRGCDPKKVLLGAAEAYQDAERFSGLGVSYSDLRIDWASLMRFKKTFVENVPSEIEGGFKKAGIMTYHNEASFIDETAILVGDTKLTGKYIIVAVGATPLPLRITGEENVLVSDDFLELEVLPKKVIFIGGGFISFEFAHLARRVGCEVTIIHRSQSVLPGFDKDLVSLLVKESERLGITVEVDTPVTGIEKKDGEIIVRGKSSDKEVQFSADLVVHGAGRMPNITSLALEKGNIVTNKKGIEVNEYLQSVSNPAVYAAGDCCSFALPLTPVAGKEGAIVAENIVMGNTRVASLGAIASVVYTNPPLSTVGISEEKAKESGYDVIVKFGDSTHWYSSKRINEPVSAYKTIIDKKTGKILGASLLGHNAQEIINIFSLAINKGCTADELKDIVYAYPTKASDIEYMF